MVIRSIGGEATQAASSQQSESPAAGLSAHIQGSAASGDGSMPEAHHVELFTLRDFKQILEDETATAEQKTAAYDALPEELRNELEKRYYNQQVTEQGRATITDPKYGEHAVEHSVGVFFDIKTHLHCRRDPNFHTFKARIENQEPDPALLRASFERLAPDTKTQVYRLVYEAHVERNGKERVHDVDGVLFGKYHMRKNPALALSQDPYTDQSLLDRALLPTLVEVAKTTNTVALEQLFSDGSVISQRRLDSAVIQLARNGKADAIRSLTVGGRAISEPALLDALLIAFESGDQGVIRALLPQDRAISQDALDSLIFFAVDLYNPEIIRFLLSEGRTIDEYSLRRTVRAASENGDLETVQCLLSQGRTLPEDALMDAAAQAAKVGQLQTVQFILSQSRDISRFGLGDAIRLAARCGHLEVIRFLLSSGGVVTSRSLGESVVEALDHHQEIALFLISQGRLEDVYRQRCIELSAQRGYPEVLEALLQQGPIPRACRDIALSRAAGEHAGRIRDILNMAPLQPEVAAAAAHPAAAHPAAAYAVVDLADIAADPLALLRVLCDQGLPSRFVLRDNEAAVDLGGVTKQVISTLTRALIEQNILPRSTAKLPMAKTDEDLEAYTLLGQFCARLMQRNGSRTDRFVTGALFHERFVEIVQKVGNADTEMEMRRAVATMLKDIDPALAPLANVMLAPEGDEQKAAIDAWLATMGLDREDYEDGEDTPLDDVYKEIDQYVLPALAIYNGTTEEAQAIITESDPIELAHTLQGHPVSKEALLEALQLRHPQFPAAYLEWLREKIETEDDAWRVQFVRVITGNTSLSPGVKIGLGVRAGEHFEIHTCFNSLDVPSAGMTQEEFFASLDAALTGDGYNTA